MIIYSPTFTGSVQITGSQLVTGDLTVQGNLTAQTFILSSSVSYFTESFASGSTRFGDSMDDTMKVTGSLLLTGSMGIGQNPSMLLDIYGNPSTNYTSTNPLVNLQSNQAYSTAPYSGINFSAQYNNGGGNTSFAFIGGGKETTGNGVYGGFLKFNTRTDGASDIAERMRITSAGNVGIGTTTTNVGGFGSTVVTVAGPASTYSTIELGKVTPSANANLGVISFFNGTNGDVANIIGVSDAINNSGALRFLTSTGAGGTERMRITASGSVGIGTVSPTAYTGYTTLCVDNATSGGVMQIMRAGTAMMNVYSAAGEGKIETIGASTFFTITTNSTERMRITSGGDVGIGTTSTVSRLHVYTGNPGSISNSAGTVATFANSSHTRIALQSPDTYSPSINFSSPTYTNNGSIEQYLAAEGSNYMAFQQMGSQRMKLLGNSRNGTLDLMGNLVMSNYAAPSGIAAGATCAITLTQVQYEYVTSYIFDVVGFYAPSGTNIQAYYTGIAHFYADGSTNGSAIVNSTSTGWSASSSSTNGGTFTITFTNGSGYSMSNINIRVLKLNRMN